MATSIFTNDEEIQRLNIQYVSGYTALYEMFLGNVDKYKATEGSTKTRNIALNDLNLGRTKKSDTELKKTTSIETTSEFIRLFYNTEIQKSDYQEEGIDVVDAKVKDKLKQEYDFRFINGDENGNKGLFQTKKTTNYNIITDIAKPTAPDEAVSIVKKMIELSVASGNSLKQVLPFGDFVNILDKQVNGTGLTFKKYILENVSNINFIDPTYIKGITKIGNGGLLMVDLPTTFIQMIREPSLHKVWEDKIGMSYIYESSTNGCSPKAENSIVRLDFKD